MAEHQSTMDFIRSNGGVFYARAGPERTSGESTVLFTPHQVSSETSKASSVHLRGAFSAISGWLTRTRVHLREAGHLREAPQDGPCTCLPMEAVRMGAGVPIQMGRRTDGTLGGSGNFDGPVMRSVHPGLAHLHHMYRGSCGRVERKAMEDEWDDNQTRLEELTKLGFLEYTLGPQCAVCAARQ